MATCFKTGLKEIKSTLSGIDRPKNKDVFKGIIAEGMPGPNLKASKTFQRLS